MEGAGQEFAYLFIDSFLISMIQCNETGGPVTHKLYLCIEDNRFGSIEQRGVRQLKLLLKSELRH